jgi:hypothetical protein
MTEKNNKKQEGKNKRKLKITHKTTVLIIFRIKEDEMGRACITNGEKRNAYRILGGKPECKRPLGRPRHRWMDLR